MTPRDGVFASVSRETMVQLEIYVDLLKKWNRRINLVSPAAILDVWGRHVADSVQLYDLAPPRFENWVDIGSGGGFPGVIIAILAKTRNPQAKVILVESDARKATFLRAALRETNCSGIVLNERIESSKSLCAKVLSARALADLPKLLEFGNRHLATDGTALFSKGVSWENEVNNARTKWSFSLNVHKSKTDPDAVILQVGELAHV